MPIARIRGPGHPDALCDRIAIALIEAYVRRDPQARACISVSAGRESVFVDGDLLSSADFDTAPTVRKALAEVDPLLALEPFITCESVSPDVLPEAASADHCVVIGYATAETTDGLPPARSAARAYVRALEAFRTEQEEGYALAPDYEVLADDTRREITLRHPGLRAEQVLRLEPQIVAVLSRVLPDWTLRISGAGVEGGLRRRSGVSGRVSSLDVGTSHIPVGTSGVGCVIRHPANLGHWLARREAQRLVGEGKGRAALLVLRWEAFDTRPQIISARNERGEDLSSCIDAGTMDLLLPHDGLVDPGALRAEFEADWKWSSFLCERKALDANA